MLFVATSSYTSINFNFAKQHIIVDLLLMLCLPSKCTHSHTTEIYTTYCTSIDHAVMYAWHYSKLTKFCFCWLDDCTCLCSTCQPMMKCSRSFHWCFHRKFFKVNINRLNLDHLLLPPAGGSSTKTAPVTPTPPTHTSQNLTSNVDMSCGVFTPYTFSI